METQRILDFIAEYCIEVKPTDTDSYVELMMDYHRCIKFNDIEYYVVEYSFLWDDDDKEVYDYLIEEHHIS